MVSDFLVFILLTAAMGMSIFLSMPIVFSRRAQGRWAVGLNAAAIGILIFLLADIFSDVAPILYPGGTYIANTEYTLAFAIAFAVAFVGLYVVDNLPRDAPRGTGTNAGAPGGSESSPNKTALIIALGIGLQNLTEGLVFGGSWASGALIGSLAVIFLGFFLQNITEGFPIASPYLGTNARRNVALLSALFLVGGIPTILGGAIGYVWSSDVFIVVFDALAIGAITYVILPMLRVAFKPLETRELSIARNQLVYIGVMVGFLLGFLVNAI